MRPALALTAVGSLLLALPGTALAHGDQVPVSELDSAWNLSPAVLAPASLALALYVQGFVRLRRRGRRDHAPWWRAVAFGLGLVLAVLVLVSPIDAIGEEYLLSVHMLQHVVIGDAAAALVLLGLTGPLLFFILPAEVLGPLARARPVRALAGLLSRPAVALAIWAAVFAVWHVPAMFDAALDARWVHDLEHVTFVDRRLRHVVPAPRPGPARAPDPVGPPRGRGGDLCRRSGARGCARLLRTRRCTSRTRCRTSGCSVSRR